MAYEDFRVPGSFVRVSHRLTVGSHHKWPVIRSFGVSALQSWTIGWTNSRVVGDIRRQGIHYCMNTFNKPRLGLDVDLTQ